MSTLQDVEAWRGKKMVDADGDKIGTIEAVFLDRQTGQPAWAAVKTGLFGHKHTLVPIRDAQAADDDQVHGGPAIVGVRLRRVVVVAVPVGQGEQSQADDSAEGRPEDLR